MPGFTIAINRNINEVNFTAKFESCLMACLYDTSYENEVLHDENGILLGISAYEKYPLFTFEVGDILVLIEGKIYNIPEAEIRTRIREIITVSDYSFENAIIKLKELARIADGEFCIVLIDKLKQEFVFFNDSLGRLPVYFFETREYLVMTREIGFVRSFVNAELNSGSVAEFLFTGFAWGNKTLFLGIHCVEPGCLYYYSKSKGKKEKYKEFNLFDKSEITEDDAAEEIASLFNLSVKQRFSSDENNLISLSGGLDSRMVLASAANQKKKFRCASYLDHRNLAIADLKVAEELVSTYNTSLDIINLQPSLGDYYYKLLKMKEGQNYLGMSFILDFFEQIQANTDVYITGDGGDKILPDLRPMRKLASVKALLNYIDRYHSYFKLDQVSSLLDYPVNKLRDELLNHLENLPGETYNDKYIYFLIFERARKWLFEGEDRNRYFFWHTTPFYSFPLFEYCMSIPDDVKRNYRLFIKTMNKISPELNYIANANWGFGPSSSRLKQKMLLQKLKADIPESLKHGLKALNRQYNFINANKDLEMVKVFNQQSAENAKAKSILKIYEVLKMKHFSEEQFYQMFTLTSIEEVLNFKKSSLEDNYKEFD